MPMPPALEARILKSDIPGLDRLLSDVTRIAGGFTGACHSLAAATTIPPGREAQLALALERIVQEQTGG